MTELAAVGIADIRDVDDLSTEVPVVVQVHGDRVLLNLSTTGAHLLARAVAAGEADRQLPASWLHVVTRLIIAASAIDHPLTLSATPPDPDYDWGLPTERLQLVVVDTGAES